MADCVLIKRVVEWLHTQYDKSIPGYSACSILQIQQGTTIHIDDLQLRAQLNNCPLILPSPGSHFAYRPKHSGVHCKRGVEELLQRTHAQYQVQRTTGTHTPRGCTTPTAVLTLTVSPQTVTLRLSLSHIHAGCLGVESGGMLHQGVTTALSAFSHTLHCSSPCIHQADVETSYYPTTDVQRDIEQVALE